MRRHPTDPDENFADPGKVWFRCKVMRAAAAFLLSLTVTLTGGAVAAAEVPAPRKVLRLEAIKVEGRIQKPQAFYILQRSTLNFEALELKESFVPKILKSIDDKPF